MEAKLTFLLLAPLFSAAAIVLFFRSGRRLPAFISVASAGLCLAAAVSAMVSGAGLYKSSFELFKLGGFSFNTGLLFDAAAANMPPR